VFHYVEMFYRRTRLHAALDYLSHDQLEARQIGRSMWFNEIWFRSDPE